jgi:hypothetical protein
MSFPFEGKLLVPRRFFSKGQGICRKGSTDRRQSCRSACLALAWCTTRIEDLQNYIRMYSKTGLRALILQGPPFFRFWNI